MNKALTFPSKLASQRLPGFLNWQCTRYCNVPTLITASVLGVYKWGNVQGIDFHRTKHFNLLTTFHAGNAPGTATSITKTAIKLGFTNGAMQKALTFPCPKLSNYLHASILQLADIILEEI